MSSLAVFRFDSQEVRFIDGSPVANDVAKVLGYADPGGDSLDCYSVYNLLAIAVEFGADGKIEKAEKVFQFIRRFGLVHENTGTTERLYHACRIFLAWATNGSSSSQDKSEYVYLIGCSKNKTLKIGFSAVPEKRLTQLQVSSPHKLKLIAKIKGTKSLEKQLHKEFKHIKLSGEWFKWDEAIIQKFEMLS